MARWNVHPNVVTVLPSRLVHLTWLLWVILTYWSPGTAPYVVLLPPFPQIDTIGAVVIVWRVRGKIIRSVLCNILRNNRAQCNAHTYEQT